MYTPGSCKAAAGSSSTSYVQECRAASGIEYRLEMLELVTMEPEGLEASIFGGKCGFHIRIHSHKRFRLVPEYGWLVSVKSTPELRHGMMLLYTSRRLVK
ncbi:hypothetical protein ZHAS_00013976 [Anopheles sinensis]|uniref:Uncharacterized protein n=1 Tax=Anopheles sinensis TaxID=74873 RepID=A0A084W713_ANOSI|nr:hypothetical protein ZHAS_00013976 [Anopheles sinensis]